MIGVRQAQEAILREITPLRRDESLRLDNCLGRVITSNIKSQDVIPPFDNSAMDGFAIRSEDSSGASKTNPKVLKIVGDLPAGYTSTKTINPRQAIRIMTGAPIPKGADSVIMVEDTKEISDTKLIQIYRKAERGENIRRRGEDIKRCELVIKKGTCLKAAHIGLLASLGYHKIKVSRRPRVAVLSTGDELLEIDQALRPGKIRNSNAYSLSAQILSVGAVPIPLGIARDNKKSLGQKMKRGIAAADLLLVSGGISVGDYDFVKDVLKDLGAKFKFWKVAMRPGKPLAFGIVDKKGVFGLPGNPVSSMISFEVFVRPAILKMEGANDLNVKEVDAVLEEEIKKKKGLRYFLRAITRWEDGIYLSRTTGPQGSGILKSMALANSLIILPEEEETLEKGRKVTVRFLR